MLSAEEQEIFQIVKDDLGIYTTMVAKKFDWDDYKTGHQNRTYRILKRLEKRGLLLQKSAASAGAGMSPRAMAHRLAAAKIFARYGNRAENLV